MFQSSEPASPATCNSPNYFATPGQQSFSVCQPGMDCSSVASVPYATSVVESLPVVAAPVEIASTASVASASTSDTPTASAFASERAQFREELIKASRQAYRAKEISLIEFLRISRAANNPAKLDEMLQVSRDAAVAEGLATTAAIDWNALFAFLEKLLPLLLQLFG